MISVLGDIKRSESLPQGAKARWDGFSVSNYTSSSTGRGRIVQWKLTQANEDNCTLLKDNMFTEKTIGKLVVDKGYTAQNLFENY